MDQDVLGYSSHDCRNHTDDAVVVDHKTKMKVNESRVIFTHPKSGKELEFSSILPQDLEYILKMLRNINK